jgi:HK97 family phage prohead protease
LGGFKEIVDPGFFGDTIYTDDVFALINHEENLVLGRNISGTLTLEENETGLDFIVDPPDTSFANDLLVSMGRKDMDKCSFAFVVAEDGVYWEKVDGMDIRHLKKCKELWDVSVVTYPAFYQTNAQLFGRNIISPKEVYAEFRNRTTVNNELLLHKQQELITREHNKRNNSIKLFEKL